VTQHYAEIDLPVLHVSCWFDQFLVGTIRNYRGMRSGAASQSARDNQHLFIGPWGHYAPRTAVLGTARIGDLDLGISAVSDLDSLLVAWFDRWMKDDRDAGSSGSARSIAPVRLFVTGSNTWHNLPDWPPPTEPLDLYLHSGGGANGGASDGRLTEAAPDEGAPSRDAFVHDPDDPVPTCGGAHLVLESSYPQGAVDQRDVEQRSDVLVYTSDVLERDETVLGRVTAHLTVTSTVSSSDFVVTVADVHPDGRSLKVCDGVLRTPLGDGATAIVVDLGEIGHSFVAGHRMRVHVASSNFPRYDIHPTTTAQQGVVHSADAPSFLRLPRATGTFTS